MSEGWCILIIFKHTLCNSISIIESCLEVIDSYLPNKNQQQ